MNKTSLVLIFTTLICVIYAGQILPVTQFPALIGNPHADSLSDTITFEFSLDSDLAAGNFVAVEFPKTQSATDLGTSVFKFDTDAYSSCLFYKDAATTITGTWTKSAATQNNIHFCRVEDTLMKGQAYRMNVGLSNASTHKNAATNWSNVNLYTSTSATSTGLILHSYAGFSDLIIFKSAVTGENEIISQSADPTSSLTTINFYDSHDVTVKIKVKAPTYAQNSVITIQFPEAAVVASLPTSVDFADIDAQVALKKKLTGNPKITADGQTIYLTGWSDDWWPTDREFGLVLKGIKAGDSNAAGNIIIRYFYLNSAVVQSYSSKAFPKNTALTVKSFTAVHKDGWDIYMSGAWPIKFDYEFDKTFTPTGGAYVAIQHTNFFYGSNVWNFVASTCDFSQSTDFKTDFGGRNNCFSLQPSDLQQTVTALAAADFAGKTGTGGNGSGIFFKQNEFAAKKYTLIVWGVADQCGLINPIIGDAAVADPLTDGSSGMFVDIKFTIKVYKTVDQTKRSGQFFSASSELVTAKEASSSPKCYSVYRGMEPDKTATSDKGFGWELYSTKGEGYGKDIAVKIGTATVSNTDLLAANKYDALFYKEFTDPVLVSTVDTEPTGKQTNGSYSVNFSISGGTSLNLKTGFGLVTAAANKGGIQPLFLYSETADNLATGKTVFIRGDFTITTFQGAATDPKVGLPTAVVNLGSVTTAAAAFVPTASNVVWGQAGGTLEILFSTNWFEGNKSLDTCGISWNVGSPSETGDAALAGTLTPASYKFYASVTDGNRQNWTGFVPTVFAVDLIAAAATSVTWSDFTLKTFKEGNDLTLADRSAQLLNYYLCRTGTNANGDVFVVSATSISFKSKNQSGQTQVGGVHFTLLPSALGYLSKFDAIDKFTKPQPGYSCAKNIADEKAICNLTFNLYTNCLKWKSTITDKTLFSYFDVIYRFFPNITSTVKAVPNRVIRLVKLFPEAQGFHDVQKRSYNTAVPVTIHFAPSAPESLTTAIPLTGQGSVCLVQITYAGITQIISTNVNAIAVFLFNLPLIDTDASDASATYPIGSLDGVVAYGLQSAPSVSNASILGGFSRISDDYKAAGGWVNTQSVNWGLNGLTRLSIKPGETGNLGYKVGTNTSLGVFGPLAWSQGRSSYQFLMGSVVLITGVKGATHPIKNSTVTSGQIDLYIPTRCTPYSNNKSDATTDQTLISSTFEQAGAYVVSLKATNWATFDNVVSILGTATVGDATKDAHTIYFSSRTKLTPYLDAANKNAKSRVYYWNYADTNSSNAILFSVENMDVATVSPITSSHVIFASDSLKVDAKGAGINTNAAADNASAMASYSSTKAFYAFGQKFYQSFARALDWTFDSGNKRLNFSGLTRPATLADFKSGTGLSADNLIVVVNIPKTDNNLKHFLTNVTSAAGGFTISGNILKTELTSGSDLGNLKVDAYDKVYKADKASGLKITFSFGAKYTAYPSQSKYIITAASSLIGGTPICGIANATGIPTDCTVAGDVITCNSGVARSGDVVVCCYGLTATASGKADKVALQVNGINTDDSGNIFISNPTTDVASPYVEANAEDVIAKVATLTTPVYFPAQELGLGRVTLIAKLPRPFVRDGKLVFEGTFPFVTANTPKTSIQCDFYFGSALDTLNGNALVESCDLSNFDATSNSIVVVTRKYLYQCGYAFSDTINFILYPVELGKIDITKKFKVKGLAPGGSSASSELFASTDIDYATSDSYFKGLAAKPAVAFYKDKLCPLTYAGVYPRIPGGLTDFTFDFDLKSDTVKPSLDGGKIINRYTIWFPKSLFGDWANSDNPNLFCSVGGKQVQCKFDNPTQLVVRTSGAFGTNVSITVHAIRVGYITSNLSFYCSVDNESDVIKGTHTNYLTGSGLMAAADPTDSGITGIQQVAVAANVFNLRLIPNKNTGLISVDEPRGKSNLTIRAVVDQHSAWISQSDVTIKGNPTVHVFLPAEFKTHWFRWTDSAGFKPVMKLNNVTGKVTDGKVVLTTTSVELSGTTFSGNRVSGTVKATDLSLTNEHKYLEIIIEGLRNPLLPVSTGLFDIAIATTKYDYLLRTFTNALAGGNNDNSYKYTIMPKPATGLTESSIYVLQRGVTFKGGAKWDSNINGNNMCSSNAGKYTSQTFNAVGATGLAQVVANLKLTDSNSIFSFPPNTDYTLKTAEAKVAFKLGAKCGSVVGNYLLTIAASNDSFYGGAICWTSLTSTKTTIKFAFDGGANTSIKGGSLPASYMLPEANVDEIKIDKWTGDAANDATSSIAAVTIAPNTVSVNTQFAITNDAISTVQKFTLTFTNACWSVDPTSTEVTPSIAAPAIDTADPKPWIKCTDPATDTLLKDKLNSVHCSVTPTLFPLNMFTAIVCKSAPAPADTQILAIKLDSTNKYLSQVTSYYFAKQETYELIFTGLARGQSYKLVFIFRTTEADATKRKQKSLTVDSTADPKDNTKTIDIKTPDLDGTSCLTFVFASATTNVIRKSISEGIQTLFGLGSVGCISLTYDETVDGKATPQYVAGFEPVSTASVVCPTAAARLRQLSNKRILSTTPAAATPAATPAAAMTTPPAAPAPTFPFTLCAVQSRVCGTNVSATRRLRELTGPAPTPAATTPAVVAAPSALASRLAVVQAQVNTPAKLAALTGNQAIASIQFTVVVVSDSAAPTFTASGAGTYDASTKKAKVVITYTDTLELKCFYQISAAGTAPAFDVIQKCSTANTCGNFSLKSPSVTVEVDISSLAIGSNYSVWYSCFNNVPNASKGSPSKSVYDFSTACPTGTTLTSGSCQSPPPASSTTTTCPSTDPKYPTCVSSFIRLGLALIVALIMLI